MSTTTKKNSSRDSAGGSLVLAVLGSPLGWLADGQPVALRDRAPHGDESDSLRAQMSAVVWSLALLVVAVVAPTWWAPLTVVAVLVLVLPARTAARLGGELIVPTDADRGARGRLAVTAWALGGRCPMRTWTAANATPRVSVAAAGGACGLSWASWCPRASWASTRHSTAL